MDIEAYLDRIGYQGPRRADLETLTRIQQAQATSVPWENFDVQFKRPLTTAVDAAYDKIVNRRRGGWCYELNGVFGWALGQLGFNVTRICGGPVIDGVRYAGNHLSLLIDIDGQTWVADAAGDGSTEPYRLVEGPFRSRHYEFRLEQVGDGWWRMHNHPLGLLPFFDIHPDLREEALLQERCDYLQGDPNSVFVLNTVVISQTMKGQASLRGRLFVAHDADGVEKRIIADADDYVRVLKDRFALDLPEAGALWEGICARHEALVAAHSG